MRDTFGSSCHGAGRLLSRGEALRRARGRSIARELEARGIEVLARAHKTLGEEMSDAYKDVADVVGVMARAGISRVVARLVPMAVIQGERPPPGAAPSLPPAPRGPNGLVHRSPAPRAIRTYVARMEGRRTPRLVVLEGGRPDGSEESPPSRGFLRLVRTGPSSDLQAALEETVAAARKVRRDIEERIARALEDLLHTRAPDPGSR